MKLIKSHVGLRGIAAIIVVGYHIQLSVSSLAVPLVSDILRSGYLLVDLFFILSGFIIAYVNVGDGASPMTKQEARSFWIKRLIRIYPAHILILFAFVIVTLCLDAVFAARGGTSHLWWANSNSILISQALLLNALHSDPNGWNVPTWSISAEMFAYALFPFMVLLQARARSLIGLILGCVIIALYIYLFTAVDNLDIIGGGLAVLRCIAGFSLGFIIYRYRGLTKSWANQTVNVVQYATVAIILLLLVDRANDVLVIFPFALLVMSSWQDRGHMSQLLGTAVFQRLGEWSYSVYLIHVPVIAVMTLIWGFVSAKLVIDETLSNFVFVIIVLSTTLFLSRLTYNHVEVKSRLLLNAKLAKRQTPAHIG